MRNNVGDSLADPVESLMHDSDSSDSGRPIRVGYILDSRQLGSTDVVGLLLSEFADDQAIEWHILHAVGPGLTACMRTRGRKRKSGPFVPLRSWMCGLLLACERSLLALFGRLILNGPDGEKPSSTIRLEVDRRASSCNQAEVIGLSAIEYRKVKQLNLDFLIVDIPLVRMRAISLSCLATQGMFLTQYSNLLGADSRFQSFWDVLNREPTTPFAVEHIRAGGGDPVSRVTGTVSTQASWTATIIQIRRESTVWVSQLLAQYVRLGVVETFGKASITRSAHITHAPGIIDLIRYLYRRIVSIFKSRLRTTRHYSTWSIAVAIGEPSIENLKNAVTVANRQDHFFADPFIYTWKDRTICFAEEFCLLDNRAHIAAIDIVSTREVSEENWEPSIRYLGTVIDEPFNLGFPFVFEYENRIFLIPDSRQANSVRLYECVEFPLQWQYRHDLLSNVAAADTVVFHHADYWWLLTTVAPRGSTELCSTLYVYFADTPLTRSWRPHSLNPVIIDGRDGRNGGFVWKRSSSPDVSRVVQRQGYLRYGASIGEAKISRLNSSNYEETISDMVLPGQLNAERCHHLSFDGRYSAYDYKLLL